MQKMLFSKIIVTKDGSTVIFYLDSTKKGKIYLKGLCYTHNFLFKEKIQCETETEAINRLDRIDKKKAEAIVLTIKNRGTICT